jgi:hypothetical protein
VQDFNLVRWTPYSSRATFTLRRAYFTAFRWHSQIAGQSGGFEIDIDTPTSTLPVHRGRTSVTFGRPQIISDLPTPTPRPTQSFTGDAQTVSVSGVRREAVGLSAGAVRDLRVTAYPLIVVIPRSDRLNVTVYERNGRLYGAFGPRDFAVFFNSEPGSIRIEVLSDSVVHFYAVPMSSSCENIDISTSPYEKFIGSGSNAVYRGGNFTIGANQHICCYHVSDAGTSIWGRYETESDLIRLRNSNFTSLFTYSGVGSFSATRQCLSAVEWHSDKRGQSGGFAVIFSSPASSLPTHRTNALALATFPQILGDLNIPTPSPLPPPPHTFRITGIGRGSIQVSAGVTSRVEVLTYPLLLVFPRTTDVEVNVYAADGSFVASFEEARGDFAVLFAYTGGSVILLGLSDASIDYYAVPSSRACSTVYLSTSRVERFTGSGSRYPDGNITVGAYDDLCFYHISDSNTSVIGEGDSGMDGALCVSSPDFSSMEAYRGSANFSEPRLYWAGIEWHTGAGPQAGGFSVRFVSPGSTLPTYRSNLTIVARGPQVLGNWFTAGGAGAPTPQGKSAVVGIGVGVTVTVLVIVFGGLGLYVYKGKRRRKEDHISAGVEAYTGGADGPVCVSPQYKRRGNGLSPR